MASYYVQPERSTLHGNFSRENKPILTISPGDSVIFSLLEPDWRIEPLEPKTGSGIFFEPRDPILDAGHAMCGPIEIRGAKPGTTLAIRINEVIPGDWGWSRVGGVDNDHTRRLGLSVSQEYYLNWALDAKRMVGRSHLGHTVALRPFVGVLGVAPAEPGHHSTHPPRYCGGNLDCKELVAGTVLYLPVMVEGALFSVGDGHAAQGDGELGCTAIECPMERVDLTFFLHEDLQIEMPRAWTPEGWITFGFHEDLTEASYIALKEMVKLVQELHACSADEAYTMIGLVGDLRATQIVNSVRGAHVFFPHGGIREFIE